MKTRITLSALALLSVALPSPADDGTVVAGDLGKRLDTIVSTIPGKPFWGVVLVARKGEVLLAKGYGFADYRKTPNTPKTFFEIASTSKMFTAAAILKLEQQKTLSLSDPLSKWWPKAPKDKAAITIHQVLSHTSGMSGEGLLPYQCDETAEEMVEILLRRDLASKAGERFEYCNPGYGLLAALVEKASGRKFEDWMKAELFQPAGMTETGFIQDPALDKARASWRKEPDEEEPQGTALEWAWSWGYKGMGGMVTTASDLHKWDRAMREDRILGPDAKKKHFTPVKSGYACGAMVRTTDTGGTNVSHGGGVRGYRTVYSRYLEDDIVVIVLSNPESPLGGLEEALVGELLPRPEIRVAIDFKGLTPNRFQGVALEAPVWKVLKEGDAVVLALQSEGLTPARLSIGAGGAAGVAAKLEAAIAAKRDSGSKEGLGDDMDAGVYAFGYELKDGKLELGGLTLVTMPEYRYTDENGKGGLDPRLTLIFADPKTSRWPVMARIGLARTEALLRDLKALAGK